MTTCEGSDHVSQGNNRRCDCGERSNPAHRTWWQRRKDRRARVRARNERGVV